MSWPGLPSQGTDPWYSAFSTVWAAAKTYIDTALTGKASSAQGALADSAVQPGDDAADLGAGASLDGQVLTSDGAGGAAWETPASGVTDHGLLSGLADDDHSQYALADGSRGSFATTAQGALADSATQPGDLATVATTGAYADLSGTPTIPDLNAHTSDTSDAHDASAISASGFSGNLAGETDVQGALDVLDAADLGGGGGSAGTVLIDGKFSTPVEMASPPTVTIPSAGTATAISGSSRVAPTDAAFTYPGTQMTNVGTLGSFTNCYAQTGIDVSPSGLAYNLLRVEFSTDADEFEVIVRAKDSTPNGAEVTKFRILVDGEFVDATPMGPLTTDDGFYRILVDFGSSAKRTIIFEAQYMHFCGVALHPRYRLWRSTRDVGPKTVVFMDSFGTGGSSTDDTFATVAVEPWVWDSFAITAGRLLNWNVFPSPVGGTGYFFDGGFGQSVANRFDTDGAALNPDQVVFAVGLNDRSQTLGSVQTAINSVYAAAAAATNADGKPVKVFGLAPFCTLPAFYATLGTIEGYVSAACAANGATFIGGTGGPRDWINGAGNINAVANDGGNADLYTSGDEIHLTPLGYQYLGTRMAGALAEATRAVAARELAQTRLTDLIDVEAGAPLNGEAPIYNSGTGKFVFTTPSAGSGHTIEDEGTPLTGRTSLNFTGAGVTAADSGGKTVVTIPGASAPARDGVSLYRTTDYSWTPSTGYETVPWTSELFDDNGYHSTGANTDRITIPSGMGGTYEFIANIHVTRTGQTACQVRVKKNGSTASDITNMLAGIYSTMVGNTQVLNVHTGPVVLSAADYVTVEVFPDGSGTATVNKDWSWFRMRRIA